MIHSRTAEPRQRHNRPEARLRFGVRRQSANDDGAFWASPDAARMVYRRSTAKAAWRSASRRTPKRKRGPSTVRLGLRYRLASGSARLR